MPKADLDLVNKSLPLGSRRVQGNHARLIKFVIAQQNVAVISLLPKSQENHANLIKFATDPQNVAAISLLLGKVLRNHQRENLFLENLEPERVLRNHQRENLFLENLVLGRVLHP